MRQIPYRHFLLIITLLASFSVIVNADSLDRENISAGGDHIVANDSAITYTFGQAFVFPNPSSSLQIGFLATQSSGMSECDTSQAQWACVEFQGLQETYQVGDRISIEIVLNVKTVRFKHLDFWMAIKLPGEYLFYKTDLLINSFSPTPQIFKESLETLEISHSLVDLELVPGVGGTYTFYALYVPAGANPMEHLDDLVIKTTTLANE